jgi:photosystem II stability/assembly factor-like uncharacterized protein
MRPLLTLLFAATALAQPAPKVLNSHTTESLRGVSAVSKKIAWASGTHGTYLRTTDAGRTWQPWQVPGASTLDFRAVVAVSADEAFLMSAGPGDQSRIYHTSDAGQHWSLQFTATNPKAFFDSMAFWDPTHGVVLGDPIPDESGKLKFELLLTDDGRTWHAVPPAQLPPAQEGEGAFAASNTCLAILPSTTTAPTQAKLVDGPSFNSVILSGDTRSAKRSACRSRKPALSLSKGTPCTLTSPQALKGIRTTDFSTRNVSFTDVIPNEVRDQGFIDASGAARSQSLSPETSATSTPDPNIWFATGGHAARVFHSPDRGQTWQVADTAILHGPDSAGIFSMAFRDATHGVIAGGDYKHPDRDGPNLAFTTDGGKTWTLSPIRPLAYFSAVAYDRRPIRPVKEDNRERLFIVGQDFIFDFRPPQDPTRISPSKKSGVKFNAVASYPEGGALIVGPNGTIATIP